MKQHFYIAINGNQEGPFTIEELKEKKIHSDTLVWAKELSGWTIAKDLAVLKDCIVENETPPPIPNTSKNKEVNTEKTTPPPIPLKQHQNNTDYFGYTLASKKDRFIAMLIETFIFTVPFLFVNDTGSDGLFLMIVGDLAGAALLGAIFYSLWGGNLGHAIMGLTVISSQDGTIQKNAKTGAIREALKSAFSYFLVPIIWLLWDNHYQNVYDKVVKTYVVKKK